MINLSQEHCRDIAMLIGAPPIVVVKAVQLFNEILIESQGCTKIEVLQCIEASDMPIIMKLVLCEIWGETMLTSSFKSFRV